MGCALNSLGQFDKAIEFHTKDLNISRELGNRAREGTALGNLGAEFSSLGHYDKADEFSQSTSTLPVSREIGLGKKVLNIIWKSQT